MPSVSALVRKQQVAWASASDIEVDKKGYTTARNANLFQPVSRCTEAELAEGDGGELGKPGQVGKIQALHSSAALACNVFDYWRGRDTAPLAHALGIEPPLCGISFERKFRTGLAGKAPNLDVVLTPSSGPIFAIESKFLEPYGSPKAGSPFKDKYFPAESGLWDYHKYVKTQRLARSIHEQTETFAHLDAAQLLKHILGLSRDSKPWKLLYLWYEVPGDAGKNHGAELARFAGHVTGDPLTVEFLTYQELFRRLEESSKGEHSEYLSWLKRRYFSPLAW